MPKPHDTLPERQCETQWLVTAKQAAEILSVSERTIRAMMADEKFELCHIGGSVRIWLSSLLDFCRANTIHIAGADTTK